MNRHLLKPDQALINKEFYTIGCGGCHFSKPKPDKSEYHCIAGGSLWPDGTNLSCGYFKRKPRKREPD